MSTRGLLAFLARLPALVLIAFVQVYQRTLSPALPVITMGRCGCRFTPTCSHYAVEALRTHGALRGVWLAARRLLKCTPLHPGGDDPVPPAQTARPVCHNVSFRSGLARQESAS